MCVIIYKPKKATLTKKTLKKCWQSNPDSGGFMFSHNGILRIEKGFTAFRIMYQKFRECERRYNENFVLHFRIATHGKINKDNSHPFFVDNKIGFAHNGILDCVAKHKDKSDTMIFNENVLQKLPINFLTETPYQIMLESVAKQQRSKFAFLTNRGVCHIFNESAGEWKNGSWFSNMLWDYSADFGFSSYTKKSYKYDYTKYTTEIQSECVWCGCYIPDCNMEEPICDKCIAELETAKIQGWI